MRVLKIILLVLMPVLALAAFLVVISGAVPYKVYAVDSGSMTPTIPTRSAVVVRENRYQVGQVITFMASGRTVTHRLVSINAEGVATTKGDGNKTVDAWQIPAGQIIGGVVAAPRQLGYWLIYLKNPIGMASVLVSLLLWWQVWSLTKSSPDEPPPDEPDTSHPPGWREYPLSC